jgi:putative oxidoreductase
MFNLAILAGRILLAVIMVVGGYGKLMAAGPTQAYITASGLPVPSLAYAVSVFIELVVGLAFAAGLLTRASALVLAGWCLVTAAIFHSDFGDHAQQIQLLKNMAMAGGFLYAYAAGGGAFSLDAVLFRRPAATFRTA